MVPFLSQHSWLRRLPAPCADVLIPHLSLIELHRGAVPASYRGHACVWFPLTCAIAVEATTMAGDGVFQLFFKGHGACQLHEEFAPHIRARFTTVEAGFALCGLRSEIWAVLGQLSLRDHFVLTTLVWMVETLGNNSICAASHSNSQRLAGLLLQASHAFGQSHGICLSHQQIATFLSARRETVSELIVRWVEARILQTGRARIEIVDRSRLEAISCDCWQSVLRSTRRAASQWAEGLDCTPAIPPPPPKKKFQKSRLNRLPAQQCSIGLDLPLAVIPLALRPNGSRP